MTLQRKAFLFFTLLVLVILTQTVILDWGSEATFFATWLFLALTVQHDSRLSVAVGLVFLATCPFLLIAAKEAVAEQAANYAYLFLVIGVLVQIEELVLKRYGWLERKLDLSPLWRPVGRVRALLVLLLLALTMAGMVWFYDLETVDRPVRRDMAYDFIEHLDAAEHTVPAAAGEEIKASMWNIEKMLRRVLYQHPAFSGASRVAYTVSIGEGYVLAFDLATAPESWDQLGDGVTFAVYVESKPNTQDVVRNTRQIFSTYIDPKQDEAARRWHPYTLDLSEYAGQTVTLIFETGTGPAGDYGYDWAGWGAPRLLGP